MRRTARILITVTMLSGLVIAGYILLQFGLNGNDADTVTVVEDSLIVEKGDLVVTVSATGAITPIRQVPLVFELSAPVKEIAVQEGQRVQVGDVLATLDITDLQNALTNAQITVAAQQASYDALVAPARDVDIAAAQAAVTAAQAQAGAASLGADPEQIEIARLQAEIARNQLWQAQLQRDMQGANALQAAAQFGPLADQAAALGITLPDVNAGNPADTLTAQIQQAENSVALADVGVEGAASQPADVAALSSANAQIVAAQVQLERLLNGPTALQLQIAETQLQIAQLALEQAEAALSRALLVAPFDGVIARNNLVIGEAPPQGAAIQLIDPSSYYVDVAVDETDIVNVAVGQVVQLRLDALPEADITGRATRVALTPVRAGQLVTYTVRVTLDPSDAPLRALMTTTATIVVSELDDVVILPNRFIRIDRSTQQAFVTVETNSGTFDDVLVELGVRNETESQIVSGLEAGTRVVLLPREAFNPIG